MVRTLVRLSLWLYRIDTGNKGNVFARNMNPNFINDYFKELSANKQHSSLQKCVLSNLVIETYQQCYERLLPSHSLSQAIFLTP